MPDNIRSEIMSAVQGSCRADGWFENRPVQWLWQLDFPSSEVPEDAAIVRACQLAARGAWRSGTADWLESAYDGALLATAGVLCPAFGPGDIGAAHAVDESVEVAELVTAAQAYARVISEWCGVESS